MAKKVRRTRSRSSSRPRARAGTRKIQHSKTAAEKRTTAEQFAEDYAYVLRDLRRIFILAGAMFVLLIALNLILQ